MRICRECGVDEMNAEFKPKANICKSCNSEYMKAYRARNREKIRGQVQEWKDNNREEYRAANRRYYSTPNGREKTLNRVKRTPRTWLAHLLSTIRCKVKKPGPHDSKEWIRRQYEIDLDFLVGMFADQGGLCALSGLPMSHVFNDLRSISVDRVDSDLGYIRGNVQLVCKWVNLAKGRHSNEEFVGLLGELRF